VQRGQSGMIGAKLTVSILYAQQHSGHFNHHVAAAWLEYDGGMLNSFQSHHDVLNSTRMD